MHILGVVTQNYKVERKVHKDKPLPDGRKKSTYFLTSSKYALLTILV